MEVFKHPSVGPFVSGLTVSGILGISQQQHPQHTRAHTVSLIIPVSAQSVAGFQCDVVAFPFHC